MQAVVQRLLEEQVSLTATQLQALEIIPVSFRVWSTYSKTINGLTEILTTLEQLLHRGFREAEGQLPCYPGASGNNERRRVLAAAALFSKAGSAVQKQCCLEGSTSEAPSHMRPLLPSSLSHLTLCSFWALFHGVWGRRGLNPGVWEVFPQPSVATSSSLQATPTGVVALISSDSLSQKVPWPCPGLPAAHG